MVTPGQRAQMTDPLGRTHERDIAQTCFGCHATMVSASRLVPNERFLGVGCEACHGAGKPHVEAVRAGRRDRRIARLGEWSAPRLNALCGRCHRTERELDPFDARQREQTQRFQPYGLMKSACFQKGGKRLSCLTCHDPHENARRDTAFYEKVCVRCHRPADPKQKVCPVSYLAQIYAALRDPRAVAAQQTFQRMHQAAARRQKLYRAYLTNPDDPRVRVDLAEMELADGNTEEAFDLAREVLRQDPDDPRALDLLHRIVTLPVGQTSGLSKGRDKTVEQASGLSKKRDKTVEE
ncbi:MAG: cytochrome c3 family protein, partial [Abditibacteriales bacterium]|nr:cytochrome c3 family protein [Abditibacteriales bacterium]MDW8367728.1 cytochrome c3 family protein [Abditibacteriales bacterium]